MVLSLLPISALAAGETAEAPAFKSDLSTDTVTYTVGETTVKPLSVTVNAVSDGGTLTYQWYSSISNSATEGMAITDTGASGTVPSDGSLNYTPSAATAGTVYYYIVITNTVTEKTPATATSKVANVTVNGGDTSFTLTVDTTGVPSDAAASFDTAGMPSAESGIYVRDWAGGDSISLLIYIKGYDAENYIFKGWSINGADPVMTGGAAPFTACGLTVSTGISDKTTESCPYVGGTVKLDGSVGSSFKDVTLTPVFEARGSAATKAAPASELLDGEVTKVTVSVGTSWAIMKEWQLFAYSDKNKDNATPIKTGKSATSFSLDPGDYWIKGMPLKASDPSLGGISITVDADHTEFTLCGSSIKCGNTGWAEGTDYTKTVAVNNQDNAVTREIKLGVMGKLPSLLALKNDTVKVTIIPSEAKKAAGYQETMGQTNPLTNFEAITVTCQEPVGVTFTAPAGSDILVGRQQGYYTYSYETPASATSDGSGVSATYMLRKDTTYFYRVSHPDGVTYWKFSKWAEGGTVAVSAEELHLNDGAFTKSTVIRDFSSNESDVGSIYLNINEKGYLTLAQGGTYALNVSRSWQAIESISNAETALPDMHYAVIDPETGAASDVVTITPGVHNSSTATLTAAKAGTAIVLVTYDAMSYPGAMNAVETGGAADPKFSAIWPENTGVFVVSVGSDGSAIATNMTINKGRNDTKVEKAVGDALDGELDVLYYVDGTGGASYTFIPESGCAVSVLQPTLTEDRMTYSGGFEDTDVTVDGETGAVTVSGLNEGRHIVKVTKGGVSTYQVITAKPLTYTMFYTSTKEPVTADTVLKPGDRIVIQYSGLFDPAGKLAGIYNFNTGVNLKSQTGDEFNGGGGAYGVYNFPSATPFQRVGVTIPLYITSDTLELTGCLRQGGYGSPLGTHRALDYSVGVNPNFSAPQHRTFMGALPSVTLKVEYDKDMPSCLIRPLDGSTPIEDFTIVDLKDADGNAVYPTGGVFRATAGTYSFSIQAMGYLYYQGSVTVTADGENIIQIPMTKLGANPWDGATLTKPQKDADGTYLIGTGPELAWYINYLTDTSNDLTVNARLTADIELAGYPFITGAYLAGMFDGAGHKIDNLYIHKSINGGEIIGGLFTGVNGRGTKDGVTQNAAVKNVTVNGTIDVTFSVANGLLTGLTQVGGIVGSMNWANSDLYRGNPNRCNAVTNCVCNVDITVNCSVGGSSGYVIKVGGIAASSCGASDSNGITNIGLNRVVDCVNYGNIVVNTSGSDKVNLEVGGITGDIGLGTELKNVSNHGNVNVRASGAIGNMSVGGIVGFGDYNRSTTSEGNTDTPTVLEHMWNTGAVSAVYEGEDTGDQVHQRIRIGGVAGSLAIQANRSSKSFSGAYNQGTVSAQWEAGAGTPYAGGIIGWISPKSGEAFEASRLYTTQGVVLGGTRYAPDGSNYIYTFTNSYYQAEADSSFGTKLNPAVLNLTPETAQEADKTGVRNYCNALKCIPEAALTQTDRANLAKLERLLGALGETVTVSVKVYDFAAKNAGITGASATGTVLNRAYVQCAMGSTAADALAVAFTAGDLAYEIKDTSYGPYLFSVNGLSNGWMVTYNDDQFDNLGLGAITVREGDQMEVHWTNDMGADIGAATAGLPILTSLTLGGTTVTMEKEIDWSAGSARTTYYLVSGQNKREMTGTGSEGDPFVINVVVPDGTGLTNLSASYTTCLDKDYATVTGLETKDFSSHVDVTLSSRTGGVTYYTVKVSEKPSGSTGEPSDDGKIGVSFRLIGSTRAEDVDLSTGKAGFNGAEYVTWIKTRSYRLDEYSTVGDLFKTALDGAGLSYKGLNSNYISSITAPSIVGGYELSEFTNGKYSGWMYTVNGEHPAFGLNSFMLSDGDEVVWHYVNDYRYEVHDWFDEPDYPALGDGTYWSWWLLAADVMPTADNAPKTGTSGVAGATTKLTPKVTASNGTAAVTISTGDLTGALKDVKDNGGGAIVIAPEITGTANKVTIELPKPSLSAAADTTAELIVETPVGHITIPHGALGSITAQATGSSVTVSLGTVDASSLTADEQKAVGSSTVYDISIISGGSHISSFGSGGITISLPYTLKAGEDPSNVTVWYLDDLGKLQQMTASYDKTTGLATFTTTHLSKYLVKYDAWTNPYGDVKSADWFFGAVKFISQNSLMSGTTAASFEPNAGMTRAMLVTVLYRMEGKPAVTGTNSFYDVQSGQWYTDAVIWASANKIISGYGNGLFGTNDSVTREQLATTLYNYAKYKGNDVTKTADLGAYTDASSVSTWAGTGMKWAVSESLVTGTSATTISPTGNASRAQVAMTLMRFVENILR
jgi:hypothetical protein